VARDGTSPAGITVAVKVFEFRGEEQAREWLARTQVLRHVVSPGLAATLNVFLGDPMHHRGVAKAAEAARLQYLVMEFVGGSSLREWVDDHPEATFRTRVELLRTVAAALDALHRGIEGSVPPVAHGDVKPDNLRVTSDGGIKLVDFGLMRLAADGGRGPAMATLAYTAPEVLAGGLPTPESDRFSFAATVFSAFTGLVPPVREDGLGPDLDAMQDLLRACPLVAGRPEVPAALMSGLALAPADRPDRLVPWLSGVVASSTTDATPTVVVNRDGLPTPVTVPGPVAGPARLIGKARRPARRGGIAAVAAAAAVLGAALATWALTAHRGHDVTSPAPRLRASQTPTTATGYPPVALPGRECGRTGTGPYAVAATGTSLTSCPFALNVRDAYVRSRANGAAVSISVFSPVARKGYAMRCSGEQPVTCSGGNNAVVYLYGGAATFAGSPP
jgi:serine/threonine-protein kinase